MNYVNNFEFVHRTRQKYIQAFFPSIRYSVCAILLVLPFLNQFLAKLQMKLQIPFQSQIEIFARTKASIYAARY